MREDGSMGIWAFLFISTLVASPDVSIVIPTYNEAARIVSQIRALQRLKPAPEIIVADGESSDGTLALAASLNVKTVSLARSRGRQLNAGAKKSTGDILVFLHADTELPQKAYEEMLAAIAQGISGGAYRFSLDHSQSWHSIVERMVDFRVRVLRLPYGDQTYFVRRELFYGKVGPFVPQPLLEDVEWFGRLKKFGNYKILSSAITTSDRRISRRGWKKSSAINCGVLMGYFLGVNPVSLARIYERF